MKKKITRPDGTIEEIEGTAEEFAELEKSGKKESKERKRDVLKGKEQDALGEILKRLKEIEGPQQPVLIPAYPCPRPHSDEWLTPWVKPWEITWTGKDVTVEPCITAQFFRDNPKEKIAMISCPCPRCTVRCEVVTNEMPIDTTALKISGHVPMFGELPLDTVDSLINN